MVFSLSFHTVRVSGQLTVVDREGGQVPLGRERGKKWPIQGSEINVTYVTDYA